MLPVRHPRSWLLAGWALIIAAIVVCLMPGRSLPETGVSDKFEHMLLYAGLMVWFGGLYPRNRYWLIALLLFVMGVAIEIAQETMNLGRTGDVRDVVANTTGVIIGLVFSVAGLGGWAQWIDGWTRRREPARTD